MIHIENFTWFFALSKVHVQHAAKFLRTCKSLCKLIHTQCMFGTADSQQIFRIFLNTTHNLFVHILCQFTSKNRIKVLTVVLLLEI